MATIHHQPETAVSGTAMRRVEEPRIDQGKWEGIIKQDVGMSPQNRKLTKSMVLWRQAQLAQLRVLLHHFSIIKRTGSKPSWDDRKNQHFNRSWRIT